MNEKTYEELTTAEKLIVGLIYDNYIKWISQRLNLKYLKNSLFTDFKYTVKLNPVLKEYANYSYLWGYEEELKSKNDKSPLFEFNEIVNEKLEEFKKENKKPVKESLFNIFKSK